MFESSTTEARPAPANVVLVGDSLAEQAAQYLEALVRPATFTPQYFGGTAPCDWVGKDLQITAQSLVVVSFTGNTLSPCMGDGAGGYLEGEAVVDAYRRDVTTLIDLAHDAGAGVLLVGQPVHADSVPGNAIVAGLNEVYADLAEASDVGFVDAGAAVENPDGAFATTLPCLGGEESCDPTGHNNVRSDDGLHFCPGSPPPGPCTTYASGAFRFASAIGEAVHRG